MKPKHCRRVAATFAALLLALPGGPWARAGTAEPSRFAYGPHDGGVPTVRTDAAKFKRCADPGPGQPFGTATPVEVGLDAAALEAVADFHLQKLQETLYVLRFGCLVTTSALNPLFDTKVKHQWSITKPVATSVLGIAVTKGYLSVDDPVGKYLPELDEAHGRVTVRQLLTHTQGTHLNLSREFQVTFNPRTWFSRSVGAAGTTSSCRTSGWPSTPHRSTTTSTTTPTTSTPCRGTRGSRTRGSTSSSGC